MGPVNVTRSYFEAVPCSSEQQRTLVAASWCALFKAGSRGLAPIPARCALTVAVPHGTKQRPEPGCGRALSVGRGQLFLPPPSAGPLPAEPQLAAVLEH